MTPLLLFSAEYHQVVEWHFKIIELREKRKQGCKLSKKISTIL